MKTVVYLDRQHAGKRFSPGDRGAWGDLDQDGKVDVEEMEAMLTGRYLWHAERALIEAGRAVLPISDGWYSQRHARVNQYASSGDGKQIYVAAHLNAGGGKYGVIFHDWRSTKGAIFAEAVATRLRHDCPELDGVHVRAARPGDDTENAYNTIAGIFSGRAVGICFEPAFLDQPLHRSLFDEAGLARIGRALALGICDYAKGAV